MLGAASLPWTVLSTKVEPAWNLRSPWDAQTQTESAVEPHDLATLSITSPELSGAPGPAEESGEQHRTALGMALRIGFAAAGALTLVGMAAPAMAQTVAEVSISTTKTRDSGDKNSPSSRAKTANAATVAAPKRTAPTQAATRKLPPLPANPNRYQIDQEIDRVSEQHGLPPDLLKSIAWQESGWQQYARGHVLRNENRGKDGRLLSTDWGIVQVNDRAHPEAFPRAKTDVRFCLNYAARLLQSLYKETHDWDRAVERYNGINADYVKAIDHHRQVQPWTAYVVRDQLNMKRADQHHVEDQLKRARNGAAYADHLVAANQKKVDAFGTGIHEESLPASTRKSLHAAQQRLAHRTAEAQAAHARVDKLTQQSADLDKAIQDLTVRLQTEKTRLEGVRRQEVEAQRKAAEAKKRAAAHAHRRR